MIFRTKKYLALLLLIPLWGGLSRIKAQQVIQSPQIHCLAVDGMGGVTLTWTPPPYMDNSFLNYQLYSSTNYTSGPYNAVSPDVTNPSATSYYANTTLANSGKVFYYIETDTGQYTPILDTFSTIYLTVTHLQGVVELTWNAIHHPLLPSSSIWYKIYRLSRYNNTWFLIDSLSSQSARVEYFDTIQYCDTVSLRYRVEIADTTGCTSISNISDTVIMQEVWSPPQAIMDTVSVNPNGWVDISWSKSQKGNVKYYIIYELLNNVWTPIDTITGINNTSVSLLFAKVGNAD